MSRVKWNLHNFVFFEKISEEIFKTDPMNTFIGELCIYNQRIKMTYKDLLVYHGLGSGKTATISNTLTFTGTDASSVAFGGGGTVVYTSNNLSAFGATTSAQLAGVLSDETGTGVAVFNTSPTIVTSLVTSSSNFNLFNTTATTINFGGAGTTIGIGATTGTLTLNNPTIVGSQTTQNLFNTVATTLNIGGAATTVSIGASTGTTTVNNNMVVTGNLTVNGSMETINSTTMVVADKNIEITILIIVKDALFFTLLKDVKSDKSNSNFPFSYNVYILIIPCGISIKNIEISIVKLIFLNIVCFFGLSLTIFIPIPVITSAERPIIKFITNVEFV